MRVSFSLRLRSSRWICTRWSSHRRRTLTWCSRSGAKDHNPECVRGAALIPSSDDGSSALLCLFLSRMTSAFKPKPSTTELRFKGISSSSSSSSSSTEYRKQAEAEEEEEEPALVSKKGHRSPRHQMQDPPADPSLEEAIQAAEPMSVFPEWTERDIYEELFFYPDDTLFVVRWHPHLGPDSFAVLPHEEPDIWCWRFPLKRIPKAS